MPPGEEHTEGNAPEAKHYFVDEAGDPNIFNRRGKVIVGSRGCSRYFMIGLLDVRDPAGLKRGMDDLRARLVEDPYFADVPSMQPHAKKTALAFHAKDDLAEVRREVFSILQLQEVKFLAIVRDKRAVAANVKRMNRLSDRYRYRPNDLYDDMVKRLFKGKLHKGDEIHVHFATRGLRPRTEAFGEALQKASANFFRQWGIKVTSAVRIIPGRPPERAGLQAADYFLWALQRLYERGEDRFLKLLWPQYRLVIDLDDKREAGYGVYYNKKKPLTGAALKNRQGI